MQDTVRNSSPIPLNERAGAILALEFERLLLKTCLVIRFLGKASQQLQEIGSKRLRH